MSEDSTSAEEKPPEFKAPATQDEFDRMVGARLERERAKFADYDALKDKASQFDAAEEANKTELQKATEAAVKAEERAKVAELTALKTSIAAEMGVPVEVLHGTDETSIKAAAQKVLDWAGTTKRPAPKVTALKSGAAAEETSGMTGKQKAAAALRSLRNAD
ncbi:MAG TPA: DUF4355 domain-containing protein [Galbitalea sp.]|jgi:hypothetical protein